MMGVKTSYPKNFVILREAKDPFVGDDKTAGPSLRSG
jgi:hypothetical protein